jgi:hypothetical protein
MLIDDAIALEFALKVIVSVLAVVETVIPLVPVIVNVSAVESAATDVCPGTAMVENVRLLPPPPPPAPVIEIKSTFWIRPYVSTVIRGTCVALPYVLALTPVATRLITAFDLLPVPPVTLICPVVPKTLPT